MGELADSRHRGKRFAIALASAVLALTPVGCSLFDWGDDEMPSGYRAAKTPANVARMTASQRGQRYLRENRPGLAVDALIVALVTEGRTVETLNDLGVAYDLLRRFDLSRQYYREALMLDTGSVQTLNNFGRSYALERNYGEAIRYYEMAEALDPANDVVLANLAEAKAFAQSPPERVADADDPSGELRTEPRLPWVQVAGPGAQTLVTQADAGLLSALRHTAVKPQLAAPAQLVLDGGRSGAAVPTVSVARHASVVPEGKVAPVEVAQPADRPAPPQVVAAAAGEGLVSANVRTKAELPDIVGWPSERPPSSETKGGETKGAGRYRVQLAAVRTNGDAERIREQLRESQGDILNRLDLRIERADLGPERGVFYRIQTGPLGAAGDAKNLCRSIAQRGQDCFVVHT